MKYKELYFRIFNKKPKFFEYYIKKYIDVTFSANILIQKIINCKNKIYKKFLLRKLYYKYSILIGVNTKIGNNFCIKHPLNIAIGEGCVIGDNVTIYHSVTLGQKKGKYPQIKDNVLIYPNSVIVGGITIENNSVIGANCFCDFDVKSNSVCASHRCVKIK